MAKVAAARFMLWDRQDLPEMNQMLSDDTSNRQTSDTGTEEGYALEANYPNPFNPSTRISFTIPRADHVSIVVDDMLDKEISMLMTLMLVPEVTRSPLMGRILPAAHTSTEFGVGSSPRNERCN